MSLRKRGKSPGLIRTFRAQRQALAAQILTDASQSPEKPIGTAGFDGNIEQRVWTEIHHRYRTAQMEGSLQQILLRPKGRREPNSLSESSELNLKLINLISEQARLPFDKNYEPAGHSATEDSTQSFSKPLDEEQKPSKDLTTITTKESSRSIKALVSGSGAAEAETNTPGKRETEGPRSHSPLTESGALPLISLTQVTSEGKPMIGGGRGSSKQLPQELTPVFPAEHKMSSGDLELKPQNSITQLFWRSSTIRQKQPKQAKQKASLAVRPQETSDSRIMATLNNRLQSIPSISGSSSDSAKSVRDSSSLSKVQENQSCSSSLSSAMERQGPPVLLLQASSIIPPQIQKKESQNQLSRLVLQRRTGEQEKCNSANHMKRTTEPISCPISPSSHHQTNRSKEIYRDDMSLTPTRLSRRSRVREDDVISTQSCKTSKSKKNGRMVNQYKIIRQLGSGSFAKVRLVHDTKTNELFAMKTMNKLFLKKQSIGKASAFDCVMDELRILQKLEHPNIIYLKEIINDPAQDEFHIIMQYHAKGTLEDRLAEHLQAVGGSGSKGVTSYEARFYLLDMLKAIHYCHEVVQVIHRDIKPENIVLNHNKEAILIDFGVSAMLADQESSEAESSVGTYYFYSPEMFTREYSRADRPLNLQGEGCKLNDLWALGITFYRLLTGRFPFQETSNVLNLKHQILNEDFDFSLISNEQAREVVTGLLQKDPAQRWRLKDVIRSDWVTNNGKECLEIDQVVETASKFGNLDRLKRVSNGQAKIFRAQSSNEDTFSKFLSQALVNKKA